MRIGAVTINRRLCEWMIVDLPVGANAAAWPLINSLNADCLIERDVTDLYDDLTMDGVVSLLPDSLKSCERLGVSSFGPFMSLDASPEKRDVFGLVSKKVRDLAGQERNIVKLLRDKTGIERIDLTTDANAVALGELVERLSRRKAPFANITRSDENALGSLYKDTVIVSLIFGRGVGGGVTIGGRAFQHSHHPEIGHISVPRQSGDRGNDTACVFHRDCVTGYASRERFAMKDGRPTDASLKRFAYYAAQLVSTVTYAFAPDLVVLAGSTVFDYPEVVGLTRTALHHLMKGKRPSEEVAPLVPAESKDHLDALIGVADESSYLLGALVHTLSQIESDQ